MFVACADRRVQSSEKPAAIGLAASVVFALAGCTASIQGAPPRLLPISTESEVLKAVAGPDGYKAYAEAAEPRRSAIRNQIIYSRMYAIDLAYSQYEMRLTREGQSVGFLGTLAQLGISTAGTFSGGEQAKTILHAAATGVTGAKEAYQKEILIERTISVLQQQMQARRQSVKAKIIGRTSHGADAYPLELALSDVEEYYRAGTITGALIAAAEDAGTSLQAAKIEEREVLEARFVRTEYQPRLLRFHSASAANRKCISDWLSARGYAGPATLFIGSGPAADQAALIAACRVP